MTPASMVPILVLALRRGPKVALVSGAVFFAAYAPAGVNAWVYSLVRHRVRHEGP